jgi:integrase
MRTLRLGDINLHHQTVSVNNNYGKNFARRRTNTIEDGACGWALDRLMDRARQLGATTEKYRGPQPQYFLFPRRVVRNLYDPELPMGETGLRKLFEEVREKAGVPWFEFNAFRHTGATRLAESGISPYILEERMGHVGPKMMRRYVQISQQAQRTAVRNACAKKPVVSIKRDDGRDWRSA